jgi:hypothetical protein
MYPAAAAGDWSGEALAAARSIEDARERALALTRLLRRFSDEPHLTVGREVFAALLAPPADHPRRDSPSLGCILAELAPQLEGPLLPEALVCVRALAGPGDQVCGIRVLAPYLSEPWLAEALALVRSLPSSWERAAGVTHLAPYLPEALLPEALFTARATHYQNQVPPLLSLVARLAEPLRGQVLAEALRVARELDEACIPSSRADALAKVAPLLAELPKETLYSLWRQTQPALVRRTRDGLLADLSALAPVVVALGGVDALREAIAAVRDVGEWWP